MSYFGLALEQLELKLADNPWTAERENLLREYYPKMRSWDVAERIGRETGMVFNKNQIIGKASRLRLMAFKPKPIRSRRVSDKPSSRVRWRPKPQNAPEATAVAIQAIPEVIEPPKMQPMGYFDDWPNNRCRYPFGNPKDKDFYFCGAEGVNVDCGEPYCKYHANIAFNAPGKQLNAAMAGPRG